MGHLQNIQPLKFDKNKIVQFFPLIIWYFMNDVPYFRRINSGPTRHASTTCLGQITLIKYIHEKLQRKPFKTLKGRNWLKNFHFSTLWICKIVNPDKCWQGCDEVKTPIGLVLYWDLD